MCENGGMRHIFFLSVYRILILILTALSVPGCMPVTSLDVQWPTQLAFEAIDPGRYTVVRLNTAVPGPELRVRRWRATWTCGGVGASASCPRDGAESRPLCEVAPWDSPSGLGSRYGFSSGRPDGLRVTEDYALIATHPGAYTVTCSLPDTSAHVSYYVVVDPLTERIGLERRAENLWVGDRLDPNRFGRLTERGAVVPFMTTEKAALSTNVSDDRVLAPTTDGGFVARAPGTTVLHIALRGATADLEITVMPSPR